jgi:transcriptional regulator with XRE-family HTH domain
MTTMAQRPLLLRSSPAPKPRSREIVAENFRTVLAYRQMGRRDLAVILGCSPYVARKIWNGQHEIGVDQLEKFAGATGIPIDRFIVKWEKVTDVIYGTGTHPTPDN